MTESKSELKTELKTTQRYINILQENGIKTIKDFFQYFPRTYEDREKICNIKKIPLDQKITTSIKAKIIEKKTLPRWTKKLYETKIEDENWDTAYITFFNTYYQTKKLEKEKRFIITGKRNFKYGKIIVSHPETQPAEWPTNINKEVKQHNIWRIFPIYPELHGIKPNRFAKKIRKNLNKIEKHFEEYLPEDFINTFHLKKTIPTIKNLHYPPNLKEQQKALHRIFFDRLLRIQIFSLINKREYQIRSNVSNKKNENINKNINNNKIQRDIIKNFTKRLPFELTQAQKKSIKNIIEDIHEPKPMIKLLQGDVGSGKTIVAIIAAYYIHKIFDAQSVFLAPLEVLANQHYISVAKLLLPLGIRIELLKWSITKSQKEKIKSDLKQWKIHILIGTHAILQKDTEFKNLQLAIIDEQHKFWVKQRSFFKKFGSPHILQMSATPIPRSMALAFFWEFSISIIDEMPAWRKPINTKIISEKERIKIKPRVLTKIKQWQKVFIVTPLIEESEKIENVKAAITEFEEIQDLYNEIPGQIWLLHGKIKTQEKEKIMQNFKNGKIKILISTTVIEVGIDIPDATIMIIKNSERFWLSQLHQLRGRIWRSNLQSYCFLETKTKSSDSYKRLKAMENTNDWFKLAELDLKNRGAWEILGTRQSWETDIPIEILSDTKFLETIQEAAKWILEKYPTLAEIPKLKKYLDEKIGELIV